MIKIGTHVKFSDYDGQSGEGYVAGYRKSDPTYISVHVVPERHLHGDNSGNLPGLSFWNVPENRLSIVLWEQEDI